MEEEEIDEGGGVEQPKEEVKCEEGAPEWVVTFGDMMSLLLTFFILLLSFAEMEVIKYSIFTGSVMNAFGVQTVTPLFNRPQGSNMVKTEFSMRFHSPQVMNGMKVAAQRHSARTAEGKVDVEVFEDYRGIVVSLGGDHMFQPGRADLRPTVWPFLDDVLEMAMEHQAHVSIEAHTDGTPIKSARFPTNDHLSAGRGLSVLRYMKGARPELADGRLEVVPRGDTRPKTVNATATQRRRNRRVELVFSATPQDFRPRN